MIVEYDEEKSMSEAVVEGDTQTISELSRHASLRPIGRDRRHVCHPELDPPGDRRANVEQPQPCGGEFSIPQFASGKYLSVCDSQYVYDEGTCRGSRRRIRECRGMTDAQVDHQAMDVRLSEAGNEKVTTITWDI